MKGFPLNVNLSRRIPFGIQFKRKDLFSIKNQGFLIKNERISFKIQFKLKDSLWNSIQIKGFIITVIILIITIIENERISLKNQGFSIKSERICFKIYFKLKDFLWNPIPVEGFIVSSTIKNKRISVKNQGFSIKDERISFKIQFKLKDAL